MDVCVPVRTDVLPVCMSVWHVHEVYLKARIGGGSPGTRVTEVPCQSSVRASVLLTAEWFSSLFLVISISQL